MLFYLWETFNINLFSYITFRAGAGFFLALFSVLFAMPLFIRWATQKRAAQPISSFAPKNHQAKSGTPTMGGTIIVAATIFAAILSGKLDNFYLALGIVCLVFFALIGLRDDILKIYARKNAGMSARAKMFWLVLAALFASGMLYAYGLNTQLYIPFYKNPLFNMGIGAVVFWAFIFVCATNAVNITDGLDGLATVPSIFALVSLMVLVYVSGNAIYSHYLFYPNINGVGEVVILITSLMGALIGFLWYNCHPAQIFMGDSGSLAIGSIVAYCAILSKSEFTLLLIGFIFVIETLSVIAQIFGIRVLGRRVFLMAPIHHHFEIKGWAENKIIIRFWIIALVSNLIAILSLKIR